jgi:hypothetical protein
MSQPPAQLPSSFRDPSGFVFEKNGILYRHVNTVFKEHFDHFITSGLYTSLVAKDLLIPHKEVENPGSAGQAYKIIRPEPIHFITYPWEWSFDMIRDAALLTLRLMKEAIPHQMILKDATPYNIQWHNGKLVFIDTLSFEKYNEEQPWIAYRQFCENFLGPLLIMHYSKHELSQLYLAYPEGVPLTVIRSLLPRRSRFSLHTYLHIHLHASVAEKKQSRPQKRIMFSKQKMLNLVSSLEGLISRLKTPGRNSTWSGYYEEAASRNDYLAGKKKIVSECIGKITDISSAVDIGANEGEFARLLAANQIPVIAADLDPYCVNRLYNSIKQKKETYIQPLVIDMSHPSPAIGLNNLERTSFLNRTKVDLILALALIHHLCIGKNIPFGAIAEMFSKLTTHLIIEFVPKDDEKVRVMLEHKKDIYGGYDQQRFENAFNNYFSVIHKEVIPGSGRWIYVMRMTANPGS